MAEASGYTVQVEQIGEEFKLTIRK